ncbi:hypothetical protein AB6A40_007724 [Gnathostoma spinigerum]|uniref:Uncharacterized protein n=1 Tax=Gnathostoma spinigerum TaxID=75299 RepID=A0ABD6EXM9_9BILA
MVNLMDDEEPDGDEYGIDGRYIPRIYFLDTNGQPYKYVNNEELHPWHKYFYSEVSDVLTAMNTALDTFKKFPNA